MRSQRFAFTLVELMVVVAVVGILASLLLPAVQAAREAARRTQCKSQLKQVGLGLQMFHDTNRALPAGWVADAPDGEPGWGWAARLLPFIEETGVYQDIRFDRPINDSVNQQVRESAIRLYLCPSSPGDPQFMLPADAAQPAPPPPLPDNYFDTGTPLVMVARSNYVGMFGTLEIEDEPDQGDGVFFYNSQIGFRRILDGLSHTIVVGERSSRLGGSTWVGVVHGAGEAMPRVVGSADHAPNSPEGHFDDFSSHHPLGVNFLFADGSVRLIDEMIEVPLYQGMATRAGREFVGSAD